jgi:hypothetical protein
LSRFEREFSQLIRHSLIYSKFFQKATVSPILHPRNQNIFPRNLDNNRPMRYNKLVRFNLFYQRRYHHEENPYP